MLIYVAGPLTQGDRKLNCHRAANIGHELRRRGHQPYVAHLWDLVLPEFAIEELTYDEWLEEDFKWLAVCDALFRMAGYSPGAEKEVSRAVELGLPIYIGFDSVPVVPGYGGT